MGRQTLCVYCEKACGKCSWSDGTFTPVEGWTAIRTPHISGGSYFVIDCPLFADDTHKYNQPMYRLNYGG